MLAAQALFGPLLVHLLLRDLLERQLGLRVDRAEVKNTFLGIFFDGIKRRGDSG